MFLNRDGEPDGEACAPGGDSGIQSNDISHLHHQASKITLEINVQAADERRESGVGGQTWKWYSALMPMFHEPELSFMAAFTAREAGKCGLCVFPGGRGNS